VLGRPLFLVETKPTSKGAGVLGSSSATATAVLAVVLASATAVGVGSNTDEATALSRGVQRLYVTRIYDHGSVVARVVRSGEERSWGYGDSSGECWVDRTGDVIYAGITHDTFGGARAVGPHKWKVLVGKRLTGVIVWHSRNRWDLIRTSRLNRFGVNMGPLGPAGYTLGPDGPAAGAAFLLLGACD
jgi:hypothetical protein